MMKAIKFFILAGIVLFLASCYEQETVPFDELDVTLTKYETGFNFQSYGSYAVPDSTVLRSNYLTDEQIEEFYEAGGTSDIIVGALDNQFNTLGYTKTSIEDADFIAVPTLLMVRRTQATYYPPGWWWGYPGWGWGPGWGYPGYPWYPWNPGYVSYTSYREGTLVLEMVDGTSYRDGIDWAQNNAGEPTSADDIPSLVIRWMANIDGYVSNNADYNADRAARGFEEAFTQSPYLKRTK